MTSEEQAYLHHGGSLNKVRDMKLDASLETSNVTIEGLEHLEYVNGDVMKFLELTQKMLSLYSKKNKDYGNSFDQSLDEDGLLVVKIRLGDKLRRFAQLIKGEEGLVKDETLVDTLLDLANYSLMAIKWIEKEEAKELESRSNESGSIGQDV